MIETIITTQATPDIMSAYDRIPGWVDRIIDACNAQHSVLDEMEAIREHIQEILSARLNDEEKPLTRDEADKMRSRIDKVICRVEEQERGQQITEAQVAELTKKLRDLQSSAMTWPRGAWYRAVCGNIMNFARTVLRPELAQELIEGEAALLLPHGEAPDRDTPEPEEDDPEKQGH